MVQSELLVEYRQTWVHCLMTMLSVLPVGLFLFAMIALECPYIYAVLFALCCAAVMALLGFNAFKLQVLLYPDKVVMRSLFGTQSLRLNAKTEFYYYHLHPTLHGMWIKQPYMMLKYGKRSFTFDSSIYNVESLRDVLLELEQFYQKPATETAILKGRSIFFGEVKVSSTGLSYKNQVLAFSDLKDCNLQKGYLNVKKQAQQQAFLSIPMRKIPNMKTFFAVLDYYMERKAS